MRISIARYLLADMVAWTERVGRTGAPLEMGTPFDTFSPAAHTASATGIALANRRLRQRLMEAEGFTNYDQEWWHYSYDVPNPIRFDRVIR